MSAIEASSVRVQTMADGTLRLVLDVEPRFAVDAFRLFGAPGVPVAIAALKAASSEPHSEAPKGGPLAQWVAMRCQESEFAHWLSGRYPAMWMGIKLPTAHEKAAELVRQVCQVSSRAELDNDAEAAKRFHENIRKPYMEATR